MKNILFCFVFISISQLVNLPIVNGQNMRPGIKIYETGLKVKGTYIGKRFFSINIKYLKHLNKNIVDLKDTSGIYYTPDPDKSLFYYSIKPKDKIKGVICLLPSSGEQTEDVINANKMLLELCFQSNILAVVLSVNNDNGLDDDVLALKFINVALIDIAIRFHVPKTKFIIGGLSNGGMLSLRYTELSRDGSGKASISPLAVYAADPPVDIADLYNTSVRVLYENQGKDTRLDAGRKISLEEAKYLIDYYAKLTGGSPSSKAEEYRRRSMYDRSSLDGGNAKFLIKTPIRIYCDPDIEWQIRNRDRNFYDMNAADLSSLITYLKLNGNLNAEFVSSLGLGRRLDGTRHPHSWSIVQPKDCIAWLNKIF